MNCFIVSHTHWDREWYRTFQAFRSRLVDAIDRLLDLIEADPDFRFLLDGQTVVLDDYLEIRPERRDALERACRSGRVAIGPWYVQPDSLLPSGEAQVRNLLEGKRSGAAFGGVSKIAYTPDSFGHPAQLPQIFAGFGLDLFVYWRGNGNEIDTLPSEYRWAAPDGSSILAHHLGEGYFAACGLPADGEAAATFLAAVAERLAARTRNGAVLLMNGIDHALPDVHVAAAAKALSRRTGWTVRRALLEDFAGVLSPEAPRFSGELSGGRMANLLPGVWSTRLPLKLRNRRAEMLLEAWAEPWSALGRMLGAADERPALRLAWRSLLQNQAHDSLCGCSLDRVHEQMTARYDAAEELAAETTDRVLERIAGLGEERRAPWEDTFDVAVFNPSPQTRTDVVRFPLDPTEWLTFRGATMREMAIHPWLTGSLAVEGYTVDGRPARLVTDGEERRVRVLPDRPPRSVEFVAADVPAFGYRRYRISPSSGHLDREDDGREIVADDIAVRAAQDGTLTFRAGAAVFDGLCRVEDVGDRGDTYDFDPVPGGEVSLAEVTVRRRVHETGVQQLLVRRVLEVAGDLTLDRARRSERRVPLVVETETRVAPGLGRADLRVTVRNNASDHRLRLLFPSGRPAAECLAATTFDVARRSTSRRDDTGWVHPAPSTFVQQGFVSVNGLTVAAPGLPEAEVTPEGVIALTLVRSVGWLARLDVRTRPQPAGPSVATPGAQCLEAIRADLALFAGVDPCAVRAAETGFRAVAAGPDVRLEPGRSLLSVEPGEVLVTALKPAEMDPGIVLRLLNPTDAPIEARVRLGCPVSQATPVRLDEEPAGASFTVDYGRLSISIPPHALRSVRLDPGT